MAYKTLTTSEASRLHETVSSMVGFLIKLHDRMNGGGFDPSSPLSNLLINARNAVHQLSVELHYESCRRGVNRENKE